MKSLRVLALVVAGVLLFGGVLPALAQEAAPPAPEMSNARFMSNTLMFMIAGFFGYYLLVTRPMVQKEDDQKKFLESLKKNDTVLVSSGIYGKVSSIEGREVTVEVANGVKLKVLGTALQAAPAGELKKNA